MGSRPVLSRVGIWWVPLPVFTWLPALWQELVGQVGGRAYGILAKIELVRDTESRWPGAQSLPDLSVCPFHNHWNYVSWTLLQMGNSLKLDNRSPNRSRFGAKVITATCLYKEAWTRGSLPGRWAILRDSVNQLDVNRNRPGNWDAELVRDLAN